MASHTQRYISNDLSHFVGRDLLEDPQAQYERLKAILHEGKLRRPRRSDEQEGTIYAVHVDAEGSISRNEMYFGTAVCFCDIPSADLRIHIGKYGRFGLALPKTFLIRSGASPVFYIARNARTSLHTASLWHDIPLGDAFEAEFAAYLEFVERRSVIERETFSKGLRASMHRSQRIGELLSELTPLLADSSQTPGEGVTELVSELSQLREEEAADRERSRRGFEELEALTAWAEEPIGPPPRTSSAFEMGQINSFLAMHVFSFFKFFDASLEEADPDNYYMEREWRTPGDVEFALDDVRSVFLPEAFAETFASEFPHFRGQRFFL